MPTTDIAAAPSPNQAHDASEPKALDILEELRRVWARGDHPTLIAALDVACARLGDGPLVISERITAERLLIAGGCPMHATAVRLEDLDRVISTWRRTLARQELRERAAAVHHESRVNEALRRIEAERAGFERVPG